MNYEWNVPCILVYKKDKYIQPQKVPQKDLLNTTYNIHYVLYLALTVDIQEKLCRAPQDPTPSTPYKLSILSGTWLYNNAKLILSLW